MRVDYDRLDELLLEATTGPWEAWGEYDDGAPRPDTSRLIKAGDKYLGIMHVPDAELAALAPQLGKEILIMRCLLTHLRNMIDFSVTKLADFESASQERESLKNVVERIDEILELDYDSQ